MLREAHETRDRINADLSTKVDHRFKVINRDGRIILSRLDDALQITEEEFAVIEKQEIPELAGTVKDSGYPDTRFGTLMVLTPEVKAIYAKLKERYDELAQTGCYVWLYRGREHPDDRMHLERNT